jgi:bacillolysin
MKKFLLMSTLFVFGIVGYSQQNIFKVKNKKQPGTIQPSFSFQKIKGSQNLKSAKLSTYNGMASFVKPGLQSSDVVAKKIMRDNSPIYIETKSSNLKSASIQTPEDRFISFFVSTRRTTGISNPSETMKIKSIQIDGQGITHIKSVQNFKGIEIYGSESTLHLDNVNERFTGRIFQIGNDLDVNPKLTSSEAVANTVANLKKLTPCNELSAKEREILHYDQPNTNLLVFKDNNNTFSLVWEVEIRPNFIEIWKYFIDAQSGEILRKFNATNSDGPYTANALDLNNTSRTINTYLEKGTYYLIDTSKPMFKPDTFDGAIMTFNANNTSTKKLDYSYITSTNNAWSNKTAVSAHANTIVTYQYFLTKFGRNSLSGNGNSILSFINVTNDDGSALDNAFWNGEAAFYGNGSMFKPLAGAQDVISHELGHGVVSNTANLEYYGQSGAINESYADIFGSMNDRDDWKVGEDIVKTAYFPSGALRDMSNPHNSGVSTDGWWQPAHISEMYIGEEDNAGVHTNSGIGNYAYYLFATAVSKEKAEQVFYKALTNYLTKTSQFIDLRIAVIQSSKDLYGDNSSEATEAAKAFDKVGVYDETPVIETPDYDVNNGQEFMLSYNTDDTYTDKLDRTTTSGADFVLMTKTDMKGKASVTDNGDAAVFVSLDDKIRSLTLDPNNIQEDIISAEAFWDNAAVSKDGMRVAAISNEADASIWVYDYGTEKWTQFMLYNPTTSESNTEAGGVLFADAIEFDITGEYLIYDAYNELSSTTSDPINYWDIGFIKVWDNVANTFGDGYISKLYGSLPKDVSIGNPVFSKNSPNIIAFDYFDESNNDYDIIGANLQTSEIDVIYINTTLGFPSFSKFDNKIAFSGKSISGNEAIGVINLAANKISSSGDASLLIDNAKWPVYFATGTRTLGLPPAANFTADYKKVNAPFKIKFFDQSLNEPTSWNWSFPGGTPSSSTVQNPEITYYTPGNYQVTLTASNGFGNNTSTKANYIEILHPTSSTKPGIEQVTFYPNPVTDILNISCDVNFSVNILNINGQSILSEENKNQIDLSFLSSGFYFIELRTGNQLIRDKILKN